jgi:hypothetical protein
MARFSFVSVVHDYSDGNSSTNLWTEDYTIPVGMVGILFSGHIANIDVDSKVTQSAWLGVVHVGGVLAPSAVNPAVDSEGRVLLQEIPIPYGASLNPGKTVMYAGDRICTKSATLLVSYSLNIMLKAVS